VIGRVWRGWNTPEHADAYEHLLRDEIFPTIIAKQTPGFRRIELFRRPAGAEMEFMTVMIFDNFESVRAFAGTDGEAAWVPPKARAILARFDERATH
jgi:antibiotic biosynthesis monooxygenase (ABM) superfamily enzyme